MDDEPLRQSLARQERRPGGSARQRPHVPQRIPEATPPLLGDWFIYLSIVVLVCGVVAITALELGDAPIGSAIVRVPLLLAGVLLAVLAADALVRVWRSAWAWLAVDRGRGLFRFVWAAVLALILVVTIAGLLLLVGA